MSTNTHARTSKKRGFPMSDEEANEAMKEIRSDLADLRADLKNLRQDAQHLARSTARAGADYVSDTADRAADVAKDAAGQAQELHTSFEDRIRRQPTVSVLVAAGVGAVLARVMMSGRNR